MADKAAVDFEESWLQSWKKSVGIVLKQSLHSTKKHCVYQLMGQISFFVSFYEIATGNLSLVTTMLIKL